MPNTLVSIVLPCYNVESYLKECLDSLLTQTHVNLQIIAVNDGSTDKTLAILESHARKDQRIEILTTTNQGLGAARNNGLKNATGGCVTFVDSDDYLSRDAIEILLAEQIKSNSDIVVGSRVKFFAHRTTISPNFKEYVSAQPATEIPQIYSLIAVHGKLFKKSFLDRHHISFQPLRAQEDAGFSYLTYGYARRISVITGKVYYYRKRPPGSPSITQSRLKKHCLLGRFAQIETTLSLSLKHDGTPFTPYKNPYAMEFGRRLMRHVKKLASPAPGSDALEALKLIADFSEPYRKKIEQKCSRRTFSIYKSLWNRDLTALQQTLNKSNKKMVPETSRS